MANSLAYPDREFRVRGKLIPSEQHSDDSEKLNLKLRIIEPEGASMFLNCDVAADVNLRNTVCRHVMDRCVLCDIKFDLLCDQCNCSQLTHLSR